MQGKAADLFSRDNTPLYPFAQKWASIDLTPFDNSEITTIEEHIKRKWADISAETAGEQYTPSDVIDLATALIVELRREGKGGVGIADVYDMASGGGNFLFATEDALREAFPELSVRTRGQELNDALYALAAIEARFREDARIEWGNTLTNDHFLHDKFDVIVANPPYGVDWKDFRKHLEMDASGRFDPNRMPPTSDGQLLFLQHAAFHLSDIGVATIVHSGSTLFSGDAGGGESETRRWLIQEHDIVEAIVQLPKNEFFNTGIHTYLWILNRAKPAERKGICLRIKAKPALPSSSHPEPEELRDRRNQPRSNRAASRLRRRSHLQEAAHRTPCSTTRWSWIGGTTKSAAHCQNTRLRANTSTFVRRGDLPIVNGALEVRVPGQDRHGGHRPVPRSRPQRRADHGPGLSGLDLRLTRNRRITVDGGHGPGRALRKASAGQGRGRAKVDILLDRLVEEGQ